MTDPESLRRKIADEEARLARIEKERAEVLDRLKDLKTRPVGGSDASVPEPIPSDGLPFPSKIPSTTEEKVALFRSLFRGREDVFPKLWENAKTRRKGYAPACSNEWVRGVCEKPRVKCGKCSQRAFLPVTDQVVLDHLQGRHVIGVYPLLPDETCFFLAADFDGPSWQEAGAAFVGPPPARNGLIRPPLSQPGHDAGRRIRESHRSPPPAESKERSEYRLRRRQFRCVCGPVGIPRLPPPGPVAR